MGRRKGTSAFPVARIKKMMQSDDDVGKIATVTPVLVAKALECMMENVLHEAADIAHARHSNTILPQHLKACVMRNDSFDFLRHVFDRVDTPQEGAADAPTRRRRRQTQLASTPTPTPNSSSDSASAPATKRPRSPPSPASPDRQHAKAHRTAAAAPRRSPPSAPRVSPPCSQRPALSPLPRTAALHDDDEDYDDDEHHAATSAASNDRDPAAAVAPPSDERDHASAGLEMNPKRAADRVSVQALVS